MFKRNPQLTYTQGEFYKKWEEKWNRARRTMGIEEEEDTFLKLYKKILEKCCLKKDKNKKKNIIFKIIFIIILGVGFASVLISYLFIDSGEKNPCMNLVSSGVIFLLVIWLASIVNKWIEIKKYQETWIRHSDHMFLLEKEMLKFVEEMEPYEVYPAQSDEQRTKRFIQNILNIEETNQNLFSQNMNNKEKELMDIFEKIGLMKKKEEE